MSDDQCGCTDSGVESERTGVGSRDQAGDPTSRWIDGPSILDAELPEDLRGALGRFAGDGHVETLGEFAGEIRAFTEGSISVEDLCHAEGATPHWGELDGKRYHFACFYDAVILSALAEEPVDVRTESPGGSVVRARAVGTEELTVEPREAAFSFGIDRSAVPAGEEPTLEAGYEAICPYVRAFPTRDAYELWASEVPAATVGMPLAGATEFAAALAE